MKSQVKSLTEVELKAAELASKLEQYERYEYYFIENEFTFKDLFCFFLFSVDKILKGTAQQATEQLSLMKDKDTSTLCTCISTLKK